MIDLFRQLKLDYRDYVIIVKSGNFYLTFDEDAIVINKIFKYKINELKHNIKVGFPLNSLDKVKNTLEIKKINYIVVENYEIKNKKNFKDNRIEDYKESVFKIISINKKLNNIIYNIKSIDDIYKREEIINRVEKLIIEEII